MSCSPDRVLIWSVCGDEIWDGGGGGQSGRWEYEEEVAEIEMGPAGMIVSICTKECGSVTPEVPSCGRALSLGAGGQSFLWLS